MLFADDNYIFCRATTEEGQSLLDLLAKYKRASGQKINLNKSQIFFSKNVIQYNKSLIFQKLFLEEVDDISKYLGLPNILGTHTLSILDFVKNKINSRIQSWSSKKFSKPSKEVLIKIVQQALPTYAMSVFLLPMEITRDLDRSLSKFWWDET